MPASENDGAGARFRVSENAAGENAAEKEKRPDKRCLSGLFSFPAPKSCSPSATHRPITQSTIFASAFGNRMRTLSVAIIAAAHC